MLTEIDARKLSLEAKRQRIQSHGWNASAVPLSASIGERLAVKAKADNELGDEADAILMLAGKAGNSVLPDEVA